MATSQNAAENCGKTRGIPANKELDGKKLVFQSADARTLTNTMTLVHELGHQALAVDDLYIIGMGPYAIGAGTCSANQDVYFFPNAYERVHWGWDEPFVVTKDGFYSVFNDALNGPAIYSFILYDYDRGPGDYFVIENRQQRNNTYDWSVTDSGLFIWRVRDSAWPASQLTPRVVNLMRPDGTIVPNAYGGSNVDGWDPSDTNTSQRTMSRPWDDGTPSGVAVRAIRQAEDFTSVNSITAYFDVRGPGVLVDPTTAQGALIRPSIAIGGTINVSFPVMNTGEETDTFDFTILVPSGWSATTQQMTLAAGQQATATIAVTASSSATAGFRTVAARGRSTSNNDISTTVQFFVDITKRPITLQYTGDASVDYSDSATISALVSDGITGDPLPGKQVVFSLFDESYSATTGADGVASTSVLVTEEPGFGIVSIAVVEDATHSARAIGAALTVERENVAIAITSPLVQSITGSPVITLTATEEDDGSPGDLTLASAEIVLQPTLGATSQSLAVSFDASGSGSVALDLVPADLWSMTISVTGNYYTGPSVSTELILFDPSWSLLGSASGTDPTGQTVKVVASATYSGTSPVGAFDMQVKPLKFATSEIRWIVAVGQRAIIEAEGSLNGTPAVLRAEVHDGGLPGGTGDRFSLQVTSLTGTVLYQSGEVLRQNGNLLVSRS
jgi:hypothetical protein